VVEWPITSIDGEPEGYPVVATGEDEARREVSDVRTTHTAFYNKLGQGATAATTTQILQAGLTAAFADNPELVMFDEAVSEPHQIDAQTRAALERDEAARLEPMKARLRRSARFVIIGAARALYAGAKAMGKHVDGANKGSVIMHGQTYIERLPDRDDEIEAVGATLANQLGNGTSGPEHDNFRRLYLSAYSAEAQARFVAELLTPDHRTFLQELLEASNERNLLGQLLEGDIRARIMALADRNDAGRRAEGLAELLAEVAAAGGAPPVLPPTGRTLTAPGKPAGPGGGVSDPNGEAAATARREAMTSAVRRGKAGEVEQLLKEERVIDGDAAIERVARQMAAQADREPSLITRLRKLANGEGNSPTQAQLMARCAMDLKDPPTYATSADGTGSDGGTPVATASRPALPRTSEEILALVERNSTSLAAMGRRYQDAPGTRPILLGEIVRQLSAARTKDGKGQQ
jgi:hypothetical protein